MCSMYMKIPSTGPVPWGSTAVTPKATTSSSSGAKMPLQEEVRTVANDAVSKLHDAQLREQVTIESAAPSLDH